MEIAVRAIGALQTNCYLINKRVLIDPGDDTAALDAFIDENKAHIGAILLTHGHFDHSAGCAHVMRRFGAKLYVGRGDEGMLSDTDLSLGRYYMRTPFEPVAADGTLDAGTFSFEDVSFTVLPAPGHTPGGVCLLSEKDGVLFSGDTLFARGYGRTDFPGGSLHELLGSLRTLFALEGEYTVYPGHGESGLLTEIGKGYDL